MFFASDNAGPAHPKVMESLIKANAGYRSGYGADAEMDIVKAQIRDTFEAPEAAVFLVATGTAANAILLATMANPWDTIFCSPMAHIHEDECNAPEFYSNAKLTLVPAEHAKMTPASLRTAIQTEQTRGVHGPQRGPVSITQVTEMGTVHTLDELHALTSVAREFDCKVHMDGARFTNALVTLGCTAAEMTWKAGIDAVSFGGTKNGLLGVEACVIFDPKLAWEFELRRKRGGHLFSKHRYLSAQMQAYLTDGLWLEMATMANVHCAQLAAGLRQNERVTFVQEPEANMIFARYPRRDHKRLLDAGAQYCVTGGDPHHGDSDEDLTARFVTDWSTKPQDISRFLDILNG
ncbi:beta-eliminating lyase-related protein [Yoonia sp.]|uniref:threonine aldolase family protein n=1 Tax=Yoonia sp. TaxID=2212373 RepID=UPI0023A6D7C0|nr:beta-eliminating lyase-related protein [Yoonia sp.]MDE0851422.1 beta-eliminating lyase-related protein [Yoonia sp.]